MEFGPAMADSVQSVILNDDLLTEILVRLPVLSLVLFKSVSKHWLSLIKEAIINVVTFCRNPDPPSGLFLTNNFESYNFASLDIRVPSLATNFFTLGPDVHILHACNGLLLCRTSSLKLYVYNPSISNMFKLIPKPDNVGFYQHYTYGGLKLAFDPTKSPHYKVVYATILNYDPDPDSFWAQIHTYSSKTDNWSLGGHRFHARWFLGFKYGVYWSDAIYWLSYNFDGKFIRLDIMNENMVITGLPNPFFTSDGRVVHYRYSLFESRGRLLLVDKGIPPSQQFTIYEKGNVSSKWSVKYIINLDDIINPEWWDFGRTIFCIVLGEREEASFLVLQLDKKVVQYKIVSRTLITISDFGRYENLASCFPFIPSFANV